MSMAATGSNHEERPLAQPPRSLRAVCGSQSGLQSSVVVLAVVLAVALCFFALVFLLTTSSSRAEAADVAVEGGQGPAVTADVAGGLTAAAAGQGAPVVGILFPLEERISWTDTFGAARSGGRTHAGNDLMVAKMTRLLAVTDGTIDWLNTTGKLSSYNNLPYYNILLRGDDGNDYFYVHLNNDTPGTDDGAGGVQFAYAPGLKNGQHVEAGDFLGYVGDSGNAEDTDPHLHFEIHLGGYVGASGGQTRSPRAINPYNSLKAAPTLAEWEAAGRPPLSTGDSGTFPTTTTVKPTTTTTKPVTTTTTRPVTTTTTRSTTTTVAPPSTVPAGTAVAGYTDVRTTDWFYRDFAQALDNGIVTDEPDDRFRPYSMVSRALFTAYLMRTMAPDEIAALGSVDIDVDATQPTFTDVPAGYWAQAEIEAAARLGLVRGTGDGTTFSPDALVSRAQMATMLCRALGADSVADAAGGGASLIYKDIPAGFWAEGAVSIVRVYGLMCGDAQDCFRPNENTTRAQAITVMSRLSRLLRGEAGS
jgi:murein DD-endopeptidase MepM/ murein hydrolase activator NlpD